MIQKLKISFERNAYEEKEYCTYDDYGYGYGYGGEFS